MRMNLHTMSKTGYFIAFILFLVLFIISVIIGAFGAFSILLATHAIARTKTQHEKQSRPRTHRLTKRYFRITL
jgi:hypothetical protein